MMSDELSELERRKLRLTLLEGRRSAADGFMWQAPALTIAAQAFLLQILADPSVKPAVATAIAAAGALATSVAALALFLLHDREVAFAQRVEEEADSLGLGQIRRAPSRRSAEHPLELKGYVVWAIVLVSFGIVDLIVLGAAHKWWLVGPVVAVVTLAYGVAGAVSKGIAEQDDRRSGALQNSMSSSPPT